MCKKFEINGQKVYEEPAILRRSLTGQLVVILLSFVFGFSALFP